MTLASKVLAKLNSINESVSKVEIGKDYKIDWDGPSVVTVEAVDEDGVHIRRKGDTSDEGYMIISEKEFLAEAVKV